MNAQERFHASLKFQPVDRPFRWETLGMWPETLERWYQEGLSPSLKIPLDNDQGGMYEDEFLRVLVREFALDRIEYLRHGIVSGYTESPFLPAFEREILHEDERTQTVRDTDGIIKRELKPFATSSMPQFIRFPVQNTKDFYELLPRLDPNHPHRFAANWSDHKEFYKKRDFPIGMTICGAFGHPRNLLGVEKLCMTYYDNPSLIHEILEHWADFYITLCSKVFNEIQVDFVLIWEDMAYKSGPLISPKLVEKFMLPYYRRLIDHLYKLGCGIIIVDSDGDVTELIPLFLKAGVNAMLPFEVQAGMDVVIIRKQYGKNLGIIGGIDKRLLIEPGTTLKGEIKRIFDSLLIDGGFIPCLDHTVPPDVSLDNFSLFIQWIRNTQYNHNHIDGGI